MSKVRLGKITQPSGPPNQDFYPTGTSVRLAYKRFTDWRSQCRLCYVVFRVCEAVGVADPIKIKDAQMTASTVRR